MTTFNVTSVDLSNITDADLEPTKNAATSDRIAMLKTPGVYTFNIIETKLLEGRKDGAGKQWGTASILASEVESGKALRVFLDVPLEAAMYTSATGNQSAIKTKIFTSAVSSVLGTQIRIHDLTETVNNLGNILAAGAQFRASVKFKKAHITREGEGQFDIKNPDGASMTDANNDKLTFGNYEAAAAYYQQVLGYKPSGSMEVVSFLSKTVAPKLKVAV